MAGTIQSVTPAQWDNRVDTLLPRQKCKIALDGASAVPLALGIVDATNDANRLANAVLADILAARQSGDPDFLIEARTTAAETFAVIELLTARLVQFPAASERLITIDFYVSGDAANEQGWSRHTVVVSGGATPVVNVVTVPATGPLQVGGNTLSGVAGAGFAATPAVTVVAGAGTVTVNVVSAEAEILNWRVEIRLGKLQPLTLGV